MTFVRPGTWIHMQTPVNLNCHSFMFYAETATGNSAESSSGNENIAQPAHIPLTKT